MPAENREPDNGLSRLQIRRALRLWVWEGNFATVQATLVGGVFGTGFALLLGCSDFVLGVLAAVPAFTGLLQLYAAGIAARVGQRRSVVAWASFSSRLLWIPILLIPFVLPRSLWTGTFLVLLIFSAALINISNPLWMAWITDLVPEDNRGRYFGRKNMLSGLVGMVTSIVGGAFVDAAQRHGSRFGAFAALFGTATVFALGSVFLARRSPDVAQSVEPGEGVGRLTRIDISPLRDLNFRRVIWFAVAVAAATGVAGQFFAVYQIKTLALNYTSMQLLGAVGSVASLASMPLWGYLGDKYGSRPILFLSCALTLSAPVLWLLTVNDHIPGLWAWAADGDFRVSWTKIDIIVLNLISGVSWAGVGLAQFNLMMGAAPAEKRAAYISVLSAAVGVAGGTAPLLGGAIVQIASHWHYPAHGLIRNSYHVVFIVSGILRLLFFPILQSIEERGSRTPRYVLGQLKASKPMGAAAGIRALSRGKSADVRERAARRLARLKTPVAVEELVSALDDVALPVREEAAAALGEIGDKRALTPLLRKLSDPASGIDSAAALALGKIGDGAAFASLAAMAQLGPPTRQLAAIQALGALADPRAAEVLMSLAAQPAVRQPSLRALGEREDPAIAPFLTAQLEGERDPATLATLADALGRVGDERSVGPLLAALEGTHSLTVRRETLNAVGSLLGGRDTFYPFLAMDASARDEAVGRILLSLERRYRMRAAREHRGGRQAVKARQALRAFVQGDETGCLRALAALAVLLSTGQPSVACDALLTLAAQETPDSEQVLLGVFLARGLADKPA